jgi:hydrogenase maturation protease
MPEAIQSRCCANIVEMKILVIGLGNPILGDDGVGWKVAEALSEQLSTATQNLVKDESSKIEVDYASLGGLSLMERMLGYDRVILVDSMETGGNTIGSVRAFPLAALENPRFGHSASTHDTSLMTALQTAQTMGMDVPSRVHVVAIEAKNVFDFSEKLSPEVEKAIPVATQKVLQLLKEDLN